ncbi:MAG: hypothetical protein N3F05_04325 [Candidatus Diapherotrites archaeon]|nr:hypothetical protein [Candidatus Diapherotrites archaeon]
MSNKWTVCWLTIFFILLLLVPTCFAGIYKVSAYVKNKIGNPVLTSVDLTLRDPYTLEIKAFKTQSVSFNPYERKLVEFELDSVAENIEPGTYLAEIFAHPIIGIERYIINNKSSKHFSILRDPKPIVASEHTTVAMVSIILVCLVLQKKFGKNDS